MYLGQPAPKFLSLGHPLRTHLICGSHTTSAGLAEPACRVLSLSF